MFISTTSFIILFHILGSLQVTSSADTCVYVIGSTEVQPNVCLNFSQALAFVTRDNIEVRLTPGVHVLQNTSEPVVSNVTGVNLIGLAENVTITCEDNVGMVFLNCDQLTITNLTIVGCSTGTNQLSVSQTHAEETFEQVIPILDGLHAGLFISDSYNVTISDVAIINTKGIGLVGINLLGDTKLSNLLFQLNVPILTDCPLYSIYNNETIGGGLYLLFQDYQQPHAATVSRLSIGKCEFHRNQDCSDVWVPEFFNGLSSQQLTYSFGGGAGITVMNAQTQYVTQTTISNSIFEHNTAKFGSGIHIGFFTGADNSAVTIDHCNFTENGRNERPYSGGGVAALIDIARPNGSRPQAPNSHSLTIMNSNFDQNNAFYGGGVFIETLTGSNIDQPKFFTFQNCAFTHNRASLSAALLVLNRATGSFVVQTFTKISDTSFTENVAGFEFSRENDQAVGVVSFFRGGRLTLSGNTGFYDSRGAAMLCSHSTVAVEGNISIIGSRSYAGALRLTDLSILILKRNSILRFSKNSGIPYGGAIYEGTQGSQLRFTQEGCFLYFEDFFLLPELQSCPDFTSFNTTIIFEDNMALLGSNLYGSTLVNCPWVHCLDINESVSVFEKLEELSIVRVGNTRRPPLDVSTAPLQIRLINYTEQYVMPGETFYVKALVLDELNQSIFSGLGSVAETRESQFLGVTDSVFSRLGPNGFWFIDRTPNNEGSPVPVLVSGDENQEVRVFFGTTEVGVPAFAPFNVTLTMCLLGFHFNITTRTCMCDTTFSDVGVRCNSNLAVITLPDTVWIGTVRDGNRSLLGRTTCPINYCQPGVINITKENFDVRCTIGSNRGGVGCGQCQANHSITFGAGICRVCTNDYLALLVLIIFAGMALQCLMAMLRFTIAEGYLNAILFYSNVVHLMAVFLNPLIGDSNGVFIPVSWISQNFGIQACFFDGMTALHVYTLRFVYVAYLCLLILMTILLARFVQLPTSYTYSPTKVFATLLMLCYTSLLETCLGVFAFTIVYTSDGQVLTRWYYDPNVVYFDGLHGFLFALSLVVLIVIVVPFPVIVFSPKLILRFKLFIRLKPLLDPYWAPLKPKYKWWVSFRLAFRWIPVFLSFVDVPHNFFVLGICLMCLLYLQMKLQPFTSKVQNALDDLLVTNILLLVIGYLYFSRLDNIDSISALTAYSIVIVLIAYGVIVVIICLQFDLYGKVRECVAKCQKAKKNDNQVNDISEELQDPPPSTAPTHSEVVVSPRSKGSVRFAAADASGALNDLKYTRYRESLLADEDTVDGNGATFKYETSV